MLCEPKAVGLVKEKMEEFSEEVALTLRCKEGEREVRCRRGHRVGGTRRV